MLPSDKNLSWAEYYDKSKITPEMLALGQKFLQYFDISFEWVVVRKDVLVHHLQHAPLQIVIPGHAIVQIRQIADVTRYFDTYNPFVKNTLLSNVKSALKVIITPRDIMDTTKIGTA